MSTPTIELVERLVEAVPSLRHAYDEHVNDYEQVLPHVFFGDVARHLREACRARQQSATRAAPQWDDALRILDLMEVEWQSGSGDVRELIHASLLENLTDLDECEELMNHLGPSLREVFQSIN